MPNRDRSTQFLRIASFIAGFLLVGNLAIIVFFKDDQLRLIATDITFPIVNLLATALLFYASKESRRLSKRHALAWGIIAVAQLSFALGDTTWSILEAGLGLQPFPSIADGLFLAYYGFFLIGILLLPGQKLSFNEWVKRILDIGIVMLSSALFVWTFLIGPLAQANQNEPHLAYVLSLAYPVGDLVLLWAILILVYRQSKSPSVLPLLFLAAGAATQIITDCIFSYQSLNGTYISGSLLDMGWILAYLFSGMAGAFQIVAARFPSEKLVNRTRLPSFVSRFSTWKSHLPYAWLIAAYLLLLGSHYFRLPLDFLTISLGVGTIISLVLLRQVMMINENNRLFGQLNTALQHVQFQADELHQTNRNLKTEILERQRAEEQLSHDALHDGLTDLPNRMLFLDRLGHAIEQAKRSNLPSSVLFLDLDFFKVINDSLGHTSGDQLLVALGKRLSECLRVSDTVARLGGDEFVILLGGVSNIESVTLTANRIRQALSQPFYLGDRQVYVTASIGIVLGLHEYKKPEDVLRDADLAMYRAKATGKNRFEFFNPSLREQAISRLEMENELRNGLKDGQFCLFYQPILSLDSGKLIGFEALIRWNHPARGLLSPVDFLSVAEESGLIIPIGYWVLQEACSQICRWQEYLTSEQPLSINVNISLKQFTQTDFIPEVQRVLAETGLDPSRLHLEMTESVLIDNTASARETFEALDGMGIELQVDDFGTGYSSLSYLHQFPIRSIKIDRSFIREIVQGEKNHDLVRTMVMMAGNMGMDSIAEGVETDEQMQILKDLGCKYGQGYLIARPMGSEAARAWIEAHVR